MDIRRKDRKRLEEDPVAKRKDSIYLFSKHRDVAIIASLVYLIRLQLVLNKQMHSVIYRGSKKKLLQKSIMRDMIT